MKVSSIIVSVPSFGDSFFIDKVTIYPYYRGQVSVPSFGDSFFIAAVILEASAEEKERFPSPHSGILFLSVVDQFFITVDSAGFRPLIRGFFFYD